jgi:hypothetical protein
LSAIHRNSLPRDHDGGILRPDLHSASLDLRLPVIPDIRACVKKSKRDMACGVFERFPLNKFAA